MKTLETICSYYVIFPSDKRLEINKRQLLNRRFLFFGKQKYTKIPFPTLDPAILTRNHLNVLSDSKKKLQVAFRLSRNI